MDPHSNDDNDSDKIKQQRCMLIAQAAAIFMNTTVAGAIYYAEPLYNKTPYHTSVLTGADWVWELLNGHPERIQNKLRVHKEVFWVLIKSLTLGSMGPSKHITLEKLAIFLYISVTGISFWHVNECFQHATDTIWKWDHSHFSLMYWQYWTHLTIGTFLKCLCFSCHTVWPVILQIVMGWLGETSNLDGSTCI